MQEWNKWCVDRRYSACLTLHTSLKDAGFDVPSFPPKVFFGKTKMMARQSVGLVPLPRSTHTRQDMLLPPNVSLPQSRLRAPWRVCAHTS